MSIEDVWMITCWSEEMLEKVVFYLSSLSPPKRRDVNNKEVLRGKEIFYKSKCTSCHTPKYVTSKNSMFHPVITSGTSCNQ